MTDYKTTPDGRETEKLYGDIIHLSRPASGRPQMDLTQRAKIFAPYDALRGFDEAIDNTEEKAHEVSAEELSDEQKNVLSDKLNQIRKGMTVTVTYFQADSAGDGTGNYVTADGMVQEIDPLYQTLTLERTGFHRRTSGGKLEKDHPLVISFAVMLDIKKICLTACR